MKAKILITISLLFLFFSCSTHKPVPSSSDTPLIQPTQPIKTSKIPDRREFPINNTINPCENFYEYACSMVNDSFELRDDRSSHAFSFNDSWERILEAKKKYLQSLQDKSNLPSRANDLRTVYTACMNDVAAGNEERLIVKNIIDRINAIQTHREFQEFIESHIDTPEFSFISFNTIPNQDNPSDWDIYFISPLQTLPERSYYSQKEVMDSLRALLVTFFTELNTPNPEQRAGWVIQFETEFSKTFPLPRELRDIKDERTSITKNDLLKKYPAFQLARFLNRIPDRTLIRHLTPLNFDFVDEALEKQPLDVLKSIYLFHALMGYMDDAYPTFYNELFKFNASHLGGPIKRPDRKERCTRLIMANFEKEIDSELLPQLFPNFPIEQVIALTEKLRTSIIQGIDRNTWLTTKAKKMAIQKIKTATLQLVKPRNDAEWDFNPPANYTTQTPYLNLKLLGKNLIEKEIKELSVPINKNRWYVGPLTVNAFYNRSFNRFTLPIGILQYPSYDPTLPEIANLGAIGVIIGHELGHAIDDKGSLYNEKGELSNWMSQSDLSEFKNRSSRLVDQFNKIGHDGNLTLGENTSDLVGLTFAYNAAFPNNIGTTEMKQLFFTQFARTWCGVIRPKYREKLLKTDPHAMKNARVNEQVKHQLGFKEAFNCKSNDPMTLPTNQMITIW